MAPLSGKPKEVKNTKEREKEFHKLVEENKKKIKVEDEMIKLTIDKRNKQMEADCTRKMTEINAICNELGLQESYMYEQGKCRFYFVGDFGEKNDLIDLKTFLKKYNYIKKLKENKEKKKIWENTVVPQFKENVPIKPGVEITDLNKASRKRKQEEIKDVLVESIKLKMKLKKQLKFLKEKKVIDENVILANLKLTNLEVEDDY